MLRKNWSCYILRYYIYIYLGRREGVEGSPEGAITAAVHSSARMVLFFVVYLAKSVRAYALLSLFPVVRERVA